MASDLTAMALLDDAAVSFAIVLTKIDKLDDSGRRDALGAADAEARKHRAAYPEIFATSAREGLGIVQLRDLIAEVALPRATR